MRLAHNDTVINEVTMGGPIAEDDMSPASGLFIDGKLVPLPLLDASCFEEAQAKVSAHGQGTATVVDPAVRSSLELDPKKVEFKNPKWKQQLDILVHKIDKLLVDRQCTVTATPYKMLLYRPGDHFVAHRDTEKEKGMFGTLVVQMPSVYTGGALVVRFNDREIRYDFEKTAPFQMHYTAHYADLEHWIEPVTSGFRLVMVYNLVWSQKVDPRDFLSIFQEKIMNTRKAMEESAPGMYAFPLDHRYTDDGYVNMTDLKGADYSRARIAWEAVQTIPASNMFLVAFKAEQSVYGDGDNNTYNDIDYEVYWQELDGNETFDEFGWLPFSFPKKKKRSYKKIQDEDEDEEDEATKNSSEESSDEDEPSENIDSRMDSRFWTNPSMVEGQLGYTGNEGSTQTTTYWQAALVLWKDMEPWYENIKKYFGKRVLLEHMLGCIPLDKEEFCKLIYPPTKEAIDEKEEEEEEELNPFDIFERLILCNKEEFIPDLLPYMAPSFITKNDDSLFKKFTEYTMKHEDLCFNTWSHVVYHFNTRRLNIDDLSDKMLRVFVEKQRVDARHVVQVMERLQMDWYDGVDNMDTWDIDTVRSALSTVERLKPAYYKVFDKYLEKTKSDIDFNRFGELPTELFEKICEHNAKHILNKKGFYHENHNVSYLKRLKEYNDHPMFYTMIIPTFKRVLGESNYEYKKVLDSFVPPN
jgi:hypothetical protein